MASRRNRKASRKNRKASRKSQWGGVAPVDYVMGQGVTEQSLAQGKQFAELHANQHGGALAYQGGPFPGSVQDQTLLPAGLHASARVAPLDAAIHEIQGMKDQGGGRRRKANRKSRNRRQNGGSYKLDTAADYNSPSMLLPSGLEAKALGGMNAEWALAKNPGSFAPGL